MGLRTSILNWRPISFSKEGRKLCEEWQLPLVINAGHSKIVDGPSNKAVIASFYHGNIVHCSVFLFSTLSHLVAKSWASLLITSG